MASQPVTPGEPIAPFVPDLEALIAEVMDEWKIPGLAIAVVQNGEAALVKAYGLRDVEAGLPVTTDTHFMICSITKSFTSTGLALLVDEQRLDWKHPVRDYIPEFRLHDAVATDRITVRDLLCHQSGLPRHDWIHMPGDLSPAQMLAAMRYLEPSTDIRSTFQYQNLGYLVAGMVAERISGQSWTAFTRARLTDKLHMTVTFTAEDFAAAADAAVPYAMDGDTRLRAKLWPISTTPSGGINTSIADFAHWLRLHLDKGEFAGQRLLSPSLMRELQTPRVHVMASEFAEIGDVHYGFGFGVHNYRGERVVSHGGGWIGWSTLMTMLPERDVGVAVFTNRDASPVPDILTNYVFDRVCGRELVPWLDRHRERRRKAVAQLDADRQARKASRRANTRPSHELADYAGDYDHPGYGRMTITHTGNELKWAYRGMLEPLAHRHFGFIRDAPATARGPRLDLVRERFDEVFSPPADPISRGDPRFAHCLFSSRRVDERHACAVRCGARELCAKGDRCGDPGLARPFRRWRLRNSGRIRAPVLCEGKAALLNSEAERKAGKNFHLESGSRFSRRGSHFDRLRDLWRGGGTCGHFAAQFMRRDRSVDVPDGPGEAKNNSGAQGGYDAYFGTYPGADGFATDGSGFEACLPVQDGGQDCAPPYHDPNDVQIGGPVTLWISALICCRSTSLVRYTFPPP
jgi:CubicO group peptidase (beta-lactamase class C family)